MNKCDGKGRGRMEIEVKQLHFSYQEKEVLKALDFTMELGERIGLVGTSGSGKSTFLKVIAGLYEPTSGSVIVAGETKPEEICKKVAMVMQSAMLLPASIRDNITCGHKMEEAWIEYVCEAAQLKEWIKSLPDGIDTYLGHRGSDLSGGQAQRVAIARAMAKDARIILLDEATSALDQTTSGAVMEALNQLTKGKTVIHVTHHPELLSHCNRVYSMEGGSLCERGIT